MQDGATSHTAKETVRELCGVFGEVNGEDRIISQGLWPPRSPDLNPCEFYLWGKLKNVVYANSLNTNIEWTIGVGVTKLIKRINISVIYMKHYVYHNSNGHDVICKDEAIYRREYETVTDIVKRISLREYNE
jgi:hypothetical protein